MRQRSKITLKYLQTFEEYITSIIDSETDEVNFPLKKLIFIVKEKIENKIHEGINKFEFNFLNEKTLPIKFVLIINYIISDETDYGGHVDYNQIQRKNYIDFDVIINAEDSLINYEELCSVIGHELKHIFDIQHHVDYMKADVMIDINTLEDKYHDNPFLMYIIDLTYCALQFETEARNQEIYHKLRWLKTFDKEMIYDEFKKTYMYKKLIELKEFDIDIILRNVDNKLMHNFTNDYNKLLNKDNKPINDTKQYFIDIKILFTQVANTYLKKSDNIINELIRDNKPYIESKNYRNDKFLHNIIINMEINKSLDIFKFY